jgi:hypothetical protein
LALPKERNAGPRCSSPERGARGDNISESGDVCNNGPEPSRCTGGGVAAVAAASGRNWSKLTTGGGERERESEGHDDTDTAKFLINVLHTTEKSPHSQKNLLTGTCPSTLNAGGPLVAADFHSPLDLCGPSLRVAIASAPD